MATGDFDQYYGNNPWETMDKNQRQWYDPDLVSMFRRQSRFVDAIPFAKSNAAVSAKTMTVSQLFEPHPDFTPLSMRQLWLPAAHIDSRQIDITFNRQGGKVAYHEYDNIITYWKQNGKKGLRRIMRGALGSHMIGVLDALARNAFISGALNGGFNMIQGGGTDFSAIGTTDLYDPEMGMDIWLGMTYRDVPFAQGVSGPEGSMICYTSPGVIYDIQKDSDFRSVLDYADAVRRLNYEAGAYKNIRYVQTPACTLWNCGAVSVRANVTAAITAGDGSPDPSTTKVDGSYKVGQDGMTHYIQLQSDAFAAGAVADIDVNDIITIHSGVTSAYGITDGVDFNEGKLHNRRVVAVDEANFRVQLDRPVMVDFNVDIGNGVYAYVTLGRHIHASIFVAGPTGIVAGVGRAPKIHTPPPVDDFQSIHRVSWDSYLGYQNFNPEVYEVIFSAGTTRIKGAAVVQ